ncbi:MAG TPA: SMI1/KNR4 family protein [Blastocatellia bacterium]|nr:SMI1/KNR4 family protein [Blastocatellia bacterium]
MDLIKRLQERINNIEYATDMSDVIHPKIYPPTTNALVDAAEARLGFRFPHLLREIYTKVGNGGFGPGYGLLGLEGGALDDDGSSVIDRYAGFKRTHPDDPLWHWPDGLLCICPWGCAIYSCIDCTKLAAPVIVFDPNGHEKGEPWDNYFHPHRSSFSSWIEAWLDGVDLWQELYASSDES